MLNCICRQKNSELGARLSHVAARQKDWALSLPALTIVTILAVIPAMMLFVSAFSLMDIEGFTLAFDFVRANACLQPVILTLLVFPLMVSVVVRAYGWIVVLSPSDILNQFLMGIGIISEPLEILRTEWAVILGESRLLLPYIVLSLVASLQKADTNLEEASMSLGTNPVTTFFRIVIPVSIPGLLTGTLLVFALALTAFATPLLLGGGRTPLLTTLIYTFAFTTFDWSAAAAVGLRLCVVQHPCALRT